MMKKEIAEPQDEVHRFLRKIKKGRTGRESLKKEVWQNIRKMLLEMKKY